MPGIDVATAVQKVLSAFSPAPMEFVPLEQALGYCLANDLFSTSESPPFNKALMDGYAVRASDLSTGKAVLHVVGEVTAGRVPQQMVEPGTAVQIMTGAVLPEGADAVVVVEDTRREDHLVHIDARPPGPFANWMPRGHVLNQGASVLAAGTQIAPWHVGGLAELGFAQVPVRPKPTASVLATGDELVPVGETPGIGQIRNSNGPMLVAQFAAAGIHAHALGIARDEKPHLEELVRLGLGSNLLVLSGGVSAGKLDLVPQVLAEAGVREVFHGVHMKPGKPVWFGVKEHSTRPPTLVFGLPGNPVSSLVCFQLFVQTAIKHWMGHSSPGPQTIRARLTGEFSQKGDRPVYFPARLQLSDCEFPAATIVPWQGSSDLQATLQANSMAIFPAGARVYPAGSVVEVLRW